LLNHEGGKLVLKLLQNKVHCFKSLKL